MTTGYGRRTLNALARDDLDLGDFPPDRLAPADLPANRLRPEDLATADLPAGAADPISIPRWSSLRRLSSTFFSAVSAAANRVATSSWSAHNSSVDIDLKSFEVMMVPKSWFEFREAIVEIKHEHNKAEFKTLVVLSQTFHFNRTCSVCWFNLPSIQSNGYCSTAVRAGRDVDRRSNEAWGSTWRFADLVAAWA
jgi:hypothetical protein